MGVELGIKKEAVLHNFYILEPAGAGSYVVYSGPSAKVQLVKKFKGEGAETKARAFLFSLGR